MARASSYTSDHAIKAKKLALLGQTEEEMASTLGISLRTLTNWKKKQPEFMLALKDGKADADGKVADSLYNRALGYEYDDYVPTKVKEVTYENGKRLREIEHVEVTKVHRVVPPDTTAGIFWLKNRQKRDWRDRHDYEHSGKDGDPIESITSVTYMPKQLPDNYWKNNEQPATNPTDNTSQ